MLSAGLVGVSTQTIRVASRPRVGDRIEVAEVDRGPVDAEAFVDARDEAERPAVRVGRQDHVVAGIDSVRRIASSAASPLANASPWPAPSSDARHVSSALRVGLPLRAYS